MSIQVSPGDPTIHTAAESINESIGESIGESARSTSAQARADYLACLLRLAQAEPIDRIWLQELRDHAVVRVQEQHFPSTRDEEWRFTDLADLLNLSIGATESASLADRLTTTNLATFALPDVPHRLTFVNGQYAPQLSSVANLPAGLTIGSLSELPEAETPAILPYLGKQAGAEEVFTALNTAGLTDAAIVQVSKNAEIDTPIHLLFIATAPQPTLIQPRSLVILAANSALTILEDHVTIGETAYLENGVTEIWLAENARLNHTRVQRHSGTAFQIGKTAVSQARTSHYTCNTIDLGAQLSRHHLEIYQTGEQTETVLNGLTVAQQDQVSDTHSTIALTKPYGMTRQLHKCIVDDRGHAVFNGKVYVPQAAQMTDAGQLNRNLLLSPKARVDTKPQLEIVADNVKCTHGATVGQLETDEIFYLQSRGIDTQSARKLLVNAFAYEVLAQVPIDSLRQTLMAQVAQS
ncbi:MAG: Fe-S cluster assembly protein SufD [Elainella sp. Prado103]|jgi:Fe-S cluster assembly protein SufD|nr:Fe-S cluster assembly protein SufD [Elainella sp. Prado103]